VSEAANATATDASGSSARADLTGRSWSADQVVIGR